MFPEHYWVFPHPQKGKEKEWKQNKKYPSHGAEKAEIKRGALKKISIYLRELVIKHKDKNLKNIKRTRKIPQILV